MVLEVYGGVSSGKSLVLIYLRENYGACVVGMDKLAYKLYELRQSGYRRTLELMGEKMLAENGQLSRNAMAGYLYRELPLLSLLNETVHPLVYDYVEAFTQSKKERLLIVETALPARECNHIYNEIWYVSMPYDLRIQHLMASRGYAKEYAAEVMEKQLSDAAYAGMTDWTSVDDADKANLYHRIDACPAGEEF